VNRSTTDGCGSTSGTRLKDLTLDMIETGSAQEP
jgi:hypothetical protein